MRVQRHLVPGVLLLALAAGPLHAEVAIPHTFQAGEAAVAAEVNANFAALRDGLNAALARIDELEAQVAELQGNSVLTLHDHVEIIPDPYVLNEYTVRFSGVNVQIVNGMGETHQSNGLGNLIVGYNEPRLGNVVCSKGEHDNENDCVSDSGTWSANHKSGSHNIVGGDRNAYSSHGGLVVGSGNVISHAFAVVSGGQSNIASGPWSSVSGGHGNIASGSVSSISGGDMNVASGDVSSVSGGSDNTASGHVSSVSGGSSNIAAGAVSSVSGGNENTASAVQSSISGGNANIASGTASSVVGGHGNVASGAVSTISGGSENTASGVLSSVSGGESNTASGVGSSVLGKVIQEASIPFQTIPD